MWLFRGTYCQSSLTDVILSQVGLDRFAACGENFQSHVAAGLGQFIVLLGQHRADQADDGVAAGEDAHHIGPSPDLFVRQIEDCWPRPGATPRGGRR
jgi:hypothetical protein